MILNWSFITDKSSLLHLDIIFVVWAIITVGYVDIVLYYEIADIQEHGDITIDEGNYSHR